MGKPFLSLNLRIISGLRCLGAAGWRVSSQNFGSLRTRASLFSRCTTQSRRRSLCVFAKGAAGIQPDDAALRSAGGEDREQCRNSHSSISSISHRANNCLWTMGCMRVLGHACSCRPACLGWSAALTGQRRCCVGAQRGLAGSLSSSAIDCLLCVVSWTYM